MSINILNAQVQRFASDVQLLLQQTDSRLQPAVDVGTGYMGNRVSPVEQIASISASKVTTRGEPMPATDATFVRRWVLPEDWDLAQRIDSFDSLRLALDQGIKSKYAENAVAALNRAKDNVILAAMFGTNLTGEAAGTSTTFPSGQVVGVSVGATTSNLTVAKLKRAQRVLMANDVDLSRESVYCAITARQHESLLNEIEVTSMDFNPGERPVLQEGMISRFLGINFIHTELVPTGTDDASGTSRSVPVWVKSGVHLGIWADTTVDITQRRDLRSIPWQVYTKLTIGATRLDEEKVVRVWCRES